MNTKKKEDNPCEILKSKGDTKNERNSKQD